MELALIGIVVILALWFGWSQAPQRLTVHVPPDLRSGATLAAIAQKLGTLPAGSRVLGFNYDTGERYLSVPDFLPE